MILKMFNTKEQIEARRHEERHVSVGEFFMTRWYRHATVQKPFALNLKRDLMQSATATAGEISVESSF